MTIQELIDELNKIEHNGEVFIKCQHDEDWYGITNIEDSKRSFRYSYYK